MSFVHWLCSTYSTVIWFAVFLVVDVVIAFVGQYVQLAKYVPILIPKVAIPTTPQSELFVPYKSCFVYFLFCLRLKCSWFALIIGPFSVPINLMHFDLIAIMDFSMSCCLFSIHWFRHRQNVSASWTLRR